MKYIVNDNLDCYYNHALEEYYLNRLDEDIFILWINERSILLGRNQNPYKEINLEYTKKNGIKVVRRISGGGAVYNGPGNINFTFITSRREEKSNIAFSFEKFAKPVILALSSLGVNAKFTGRNDILIDGKKISGNAQYYTKDRLLHHGTLLFDLNLEEISRALITRGEKIKDKSITSYLSRVTNIRPQLKIDMDLTSFRNYLRDFILDYYKSNKIYHPSREEIKDINDFASDKYRQYSWNYGKSPKFNFSNTVKYPFGLVDYELLVVDGIIKEVNITGDYFGEISTYLLEDKIKGLRYNEESIKVALKDINLEKYIKGMSLDSLLMDIL